MATALKVCPFKLEYTRFDKNKNLNRKITTYRGLSTSSINKKEHLVFEILCYRLRWHVKYLQ